MDHSKDVKYLNIVNKNAKVFQDSKEHFIFFDNLRSIMVIILILFHAIAAYCQSVPFWPFHDPSIVAEQGPLDILMMYIDVFNMPIFFFIAGYFVLPTIQRKGAFEFIKNKIKRLGIPLLVIILFVLPILDYFHYYTQSIELGVVPFDFVEYWLLSIRKMLEFKVGLLDLSTYSYMNDQFYMRYVWFLSELFLFMVFFCFIYVVWRKWIGREHSTTPIMKKVYSQGKNLELFILFGSGIALSYFLVDFLTPAQRTFFTLGNLIQFQPIKLGTFVGYFALGIYGNSRKWFTNGKPLASIKFSAIITFLLSIGMILIGRIYFRQNNPSVVIYLGFALMLSFLGLSLLVLWTSLAIKYWNQPSSFHKKVPPNSYQMYLVHYIPIMIFPVFLGNMIGIIAEVKFVITFLVSLIASYGIAEYFLTPMNNFINNLGRILNKTS